MKLFYLFLISCFAVGIVIREKPKYRLPIMGGIIVFVCIGYYFLRQV